MGEIVMTTPPLAPPLAVPGHEFSRDRSPVDCPIRITSWRWRWNCSCGASGTWQAVATERIYRDWVEHTRRKTEMEEGDDMPDTDHPPAPDAAVRVEALLDARAEIIRREAEPPAAAVQIAADAILGSVSVRLVIADKVVAALARDGWLHDPTEVAALRALAERAAAVSLDVGDRKFGPVGAEAARYICTAALDVLPPATPEEKL